MRRLTAEDWVRVKEILGSLPEDPTVRDSYLEETCGSDHRLRGWVQAAIQAETDATDPFDSEDLPPFEAVSELLSAQGSGPPPLERGSVVGHYRILRLLQSGGMGVAYLAERADGAFDRTVALKVGRQVYGAEDRARQAREITILARLQHPHIVPLMDAGVTEDGFPYLVMDYVDGTSLTTFCDTKGLDLHDRLTLFGDLLKAVEHAHRNLVLHQDIKPSNILVTDEGVLRLLDFGIAQMLSPEDGTPVAGPALGRAFTPAYAAPEQARGEPVTTATDVYSLGVVLHELLTGARPVRATPVEAAGSSSELKGDLADIVAKTLSREPSDRYTSVEALRADLNRWIAGHPISLNAHRVGYRLGKLVARHRAVVTAAVLGVAALVGGVLTTLWQARQVSAEAARTEEVTSFVLSLFEATDPDQAGNSEIRAEELLRSSVPRIDEELASQPLLQADLWMVVADAFQRLGNYDDALELVGRALERRRGLLGPRHGFIAESLNRQSRLYYLKSEFAAAETPLLEALAMQVGLFGERHRAVATSQDNLAELRRTGGRLEEADSLATLALATRRRLLGPDHIEIAWSLNNLGVIRRNQGRGEDARALFQEAVDMKLRLLPPSHSEVLVSVNNLANLLRLQGEFTEAERLYRDILDTQLRVFGEAHPSTTVTLNNLAVTLYQSGNVREAEELFRRTYRSWEARGEKGHTNAIATLNNLAAVLRSTGKLDEAVAAAREATDTWRQVHGNSDARVGMALLNLALALHSRGDTGEAENALVEALPIMRTLPPTDPTRLKAATTAVMFRAARGRCSDAPPLVADLLVGDASATDDEWVGQILRGAGCPGG